LRNFGEKNKKGTDPAAAEPGDPNAFHKLMRSNANYSSRWISFAKQSHFIMMERLCEAKPIHHDGKALRSKANSS